MHITKTYIMHCGMIAKAWPTFYWSYNHQCYHFTILLSFELFSLNHIQSSSRSYVPKDLSVSCLTFYCMYCLGLYLVVLGGSALPCIIVNRNFYFLNPMLLWQLARLTTPVTCFIHVWLKGLQSTEFVLFWWTINWAITPQLLSWLFVPSFAWPQKSQSTLSSGVFRINHTLLPILPVLYHAWVLKPTYSEAYNCARTPSTTSISCY